jgi:hypothetical protein
MPTPTPPPLLLGTDAEDEAALASLRRPLSPNPNNPNPNPNPKPNPNPNLTLTLTRQLAPVLRSDAEAGEASPSALDRAVCAALLSACEGELRCYPTSEAEDRALASAAPPADVDEGRWRSALAFRLGQKAHLAAMARALGALLAGGEAPTAAAVCSALLSLRSERSED